MNDKQQKQVVIINESVIGSCIKDIFTFGLFAGLLYFNHQYLSGNGWLDFMFVLVVFAYLIGRGSKSVYSGSREGAIKWLQGKGGDDEASQV